MIVAYCDQCGEQIEASVKAGVRLVIGSVEISLHLCPEHQEMLEGYLTNNVLVKSPGRWKGNVST